MHEITWCVRALSAFKVTAQSEHLGVRSRSESLDLLVIQADQAQLGGAKRAFLVFDEFVAATRGKQLLLLTLAEKQRRWMNIRCCNISDFVIESNYLPALRANRPWSCLW